jgi:hypothetical protein
MGWQTKKIYVPFLANERDFLFLVGRIEETPLSIGYFFFQWLDSPLGGLGLVILRRFTITHFRHTALGRTPLDE